MRSLLLLSFILFLPAIAMPATLKVPGDYPTIQQAIDAAVNGDVVLVFPGTYTENIAFLGKAITVMSNDGPDVTVIDGGQLDTVVKFDNKEGPDSILDGFTVTNGLAKFGGGLFVYYSDATIRHNIVINNLATPYYGGAIYCRAANPLITGNLFIGNKADDLGGGVMCYASSPTFTNNVFIKNQGFSGGAICCRYNAGAIITNNTFYGNAASSDGGGIFCTWSSSVLVYNSILWENYGLVGPEISVGDTTNPSTLAIDFSDLKGGKASVYVDGGCTLTWGNNMIDKDPLFVDLGVAGCHRYYGSACRNAGDNSAPALPAEDFEGDPRIAEGIVDIGADEFFTHLYYTGNAVPGGNVDVKIVGIPASNPVGLFIGTGVIDPPLPSIFGDWYLMFPVVLFGPLGPIPGDGVMVLSGTLPGTPPGPYALPMQALVGMNLTNLCVMNVK